ncbi:threonine--tRNA ligase, mitochondrial 1-like [Prunus avium]|uniref:threonine--tRNA ligase n=1 Tax=Prunus avium TaxID=42229 RepID=A0A6P5S186_PRUAV|nr:threonine--tRNA ligase, mitochondrial 1-like [Prunus avium]
MNRPLEGDAELRLFTLGSFDNNEDVRHTFWLLAPTFLDRHLRWSMDAGSASVRVPELEQDMCTTSIEGFYYDAFYGDFGLNDEHFKKIKSWAEWAIKGKQPFERIEVLREQALEMFCDNKFKVEIINGLPADKTITVYRCGPLVDLCRGPHIPNASFVKAFQCLKASAAYWRGNKDRESLQRVYGISYPDKKHVQAHIQKLEEAKKYDHRVLGKNQELFFFDPVSPGSCFFLPKGARIYNKLMEFIKNQYRERGYEEVISPNLYNMKLWETSGHAEKYKDNMFLVEVRDQIHQAGYYVNVDTSDKTIQKKVRQAQMAQYNYILVVGAVDVQNGQVSVWVRDKGDVTVMSTEGLPQHFKDQIEAFH